MSRTVTVQVTPHVIYNCRNEDDVARKLVRVFETIDNTNLEIIGAYPLPAANPEGDEPQFDMTFLLKRELPDAR